MKRIRNKRAGFTLLETSIAIAILGSIMSSVLFVLDSSSNAFRTGSMVAKLDADLHQALGKAGDGLRSSQAGWITPPLPDGSELVVDYQKAQAVLDDGTVDPGNVERLVFEYDDAELDDDIDNDGDGLVDEGRLVLIKDFGGLGTRIILARDVRESPIGEVLGNGLDDDNNGVIDDHGFSITQIGNRLTIRLTLERFDSASQRVITQSSERTVTLRN